MIASRGSVSRQMQQTSLLKLLTQLLILFAPIKARLFSVGVQRQSYLLGTSMLMMQVSRSSPYRSVHVARSQRWSWDRQYPTNSTLYFCDASPNVSPSSVCLSFTGARMNGGVYRRRHSGRCRLGGKDVRIKDLRIFYTHGPDLWRLEFTFSVSLQAKLFPVCLTLSCLYQSYSSKAAQGLPVC